jgi:hypothetical protein
VPTRGPASLNKDHRKKELLRITRDNQNILTRIQQAQPVYNHVEQEGSFRRNENYLKNCAEYPLVLRSARKAINMSSELVPLEDPEVDGSAAAASMQDSRPSSASRMVSAATQGGRALSARERTTHQLSASLQPKPIENRRYVLKESKMIEGRQYVVEMSTDGRTLSIAAFDSMTETTLELLVKEKNHRKLYRETNGDYGLLARQLRIEGGNLVLEGNESKQPVTQPPTQAASPIEPSPRYNAASAPLEQQGPPSAPVQAWNTPREPSLRNSDLLSFSSSASDRTSGQARELLASPAKSVGRVATANSDDAIDADTMIIYHAPGSSGSVNAQIELNSTGGDLQFRLRGLTPSSGSAGTESPSRQCSPNRKGSA